MVGGTVRDLLLGGTPKDFDILTSAEPHQVRGWLGWQTCAGTEGVSWKWQGAGLADGRQPRKACSVAHTTGVGALQLLRCLLVNPPSTTPPIASPVPQVKRLFSRCIIVGRAFPVCQVFTEGTMIEVGRCLQCNSARARRLLFPPPACMPRAQSAAGFDLWRTVLSATGVGHITSCRPPLPVHPTHKLQVTSFSTQADTRLIPVDASVHMVGRQKSKDMVRSAGDTASCTTSVLHCLAAFTVPGRAAQPAPMVSVTLRPWMPPWSSVCVCPLQKWRREGATWAQARASNASRRDFTVNGLLYEPFRWACVHLHTSCAWAK